MKLYKFSLGFKGIIREELEVEEKNKIYQTIGGLHKYTYKKSDLDIVKPVYESIEMVSLSGNYEKFALAVIEHKQKMINALETKLAKEKNDIIRIQQEYRGVIENRIRFGRYYPVGSLEFNYLDDKLIHGKITEKYRDDVEIRVGVMTNVDDFFAKKDMQEKYSIENIFVNGHITNLKLEGEKQEDGYCYISKKKLVDMSYKTKMELSLKSNC